MGMLGNPKLIASLIGAGALAYPGEAEGMYVGPKAAGWEGLMGKFTNLMDRMPRAEISDKGAKIKLPTKLSGTSKFQLQDIVEHPELFEKYPEYKNMDVILNPYTNIGSKGAFSGGDKPYISANYNPQAIDLNYWGKPTPKWASSVSEEMDDAKQTFLHEIQHAIQEKEGWARGGNPGDFTDNLYAELSQKRAEISTQLNKNLKKLGAPYKDETLNKRWYNTELDKSLIKNKQLVKETDSLFYRDNLLGATSVQRQAFDKYSNLSGEIESRDTAARMGLSASQRARQLPYSGQGIPLKDTITKMGVAAPVGAMLAAQREQGMAQEGGGLQDALNPLEYLSPARWGGGLMNMGVDALMRYFTR